jgi:predicted  nucleic acid-binding Zn-ribbon protein
VIKLIDHDQDTVFESVVPSWLRGRSISVKGYMKKVEFLLEDLYASILDQAIPFEDLRKCVDRDQKDLNGLRKRIEDDSRSRSKA